MDVSQAFAAAATSVAAITDLRSRRIPNWVTFGAALVGLLVHVWSGGLNGALVALTGAALGLAMLLPFYVLRAVGAGDAKLLAAVGAIVGPQMLVSVALYGALVGGAMSLAILAWRGWLPIAVRDLLVRRRIPGTTALTAPYGVAIASGVYLSLVLPGVTA